MFLFVRLNKIEFLELHLTPFLLVIKTLQKPVNVIWEHRMMHNGMTGQVLRQYPVETSSFFSQGGCYSLQADEFHVSFFLLSLSCGLASTVMGLVIPLHKQFFKSSGGNLRVVCFLYKLFLPTVYFFWNFVCELVHVLDLYCNFLCLNMSYLGVYYTEYDTREQNREGIKMNFYF